MNNFKKEHSMILVILIALTCTIVFASEGEPKDRLLTALERSSKRIQLETQEINKAVYPEKMNTIYDVPFDMSYNISAPLDTFNIKDGLATANYDVMLDIPAKKLDADIALEVKNNEDSVNLDLLLKTSLNDISLSIPQLVGNTYLTIRKTDVENNENSSNAYFGNIETYASIFEILNYTMENIDTYKNGYGELLSKYSKILQSIPVDLENEYFVKSASRVIEIGGKEKKCEGVTLTIPADKLNSALSKIADTIRSDKDLKNIFNMGAYKGYSDMIINLFANAFTMLNFTDDAEYTVYMDENGYAICEVISVTYEGSKIVLTIEKKGSISLLNEQVYQLDLIPPTSEYEYSDTVSIRCSTSGDVVPYKGVMKSETVITIQPDTANQKDIIKYNYELNMNKKSDNIKYNFLFDLYFLDENIYREDYEDYLIQFGDYVTSVNEQGVDKLYEEYESQFNVYSEDEKRASYEEYSTLMLESYPDSAITYEEFLENFYGYMTVDEFKESYFSEGWDTAYSYEQFASEYGDYSPAFRFNIDGTGSYAIDANELSLVFNLNNKFVYNDITLPIDFNFEMGKSNSEITTLDESKKTYLFSLSNDEANDLELRLENNFIILQDEAAKILGIQDLLY